MDANTKNAITQSIAFIRAYGVERATGYARWQVWLQAGDFTREGVEDHDAVLCRDFAPGLQYAIKIRFGDQCGSNCLEVYVLSDIFEEAKALITELYTEHDAMEWEDDYAWDVRWL
jgi:hypothetical protein